MKKHSLLAIFSIFLVCNFSASARETKNLTKFDFNTLPIVQKIEKPIEKAVKPVEPTKPFAAISEEKSKENLKVTKNQFLLQISDKKPQTKEANEEKKIKDQKDVRVAKELGSEPIKPAPPIKSENSPKSSKNITQGHYVGASYNYVETSFHDNFTYKFSKDLYQFKPSSKDNGYGLGLSYKYAFNFNKFYVAPGILWEKYWNKVQGDNKGHEELFSGRYGDMKQLDLRYRYGITSDFGYDFNKLFSSYLTVGYVANGFQVKDGAVYDYGAYNSKSINKLDANFLFGAGFNFRLTNQLSLNLEANTQKFKVRTRIPTIINDPSYPDNPINISDYHQNNRFSGRINVFKIGLMYNF